MMKSLAIALLLCLSAAGQNAPPQSSSRESVTTNQTTTYTLPPDKLQKAEELYKLGMRLRLFYPVYSLLVLLAVLYWGIGVRFRDWAQKVSCYRILQALIFVPLLLITLRLTTLPISIYVEHVYLQYGISVQPWASWFGDVGKSLGINVGIYIIALWLLQTVMRWSPRRWWFYFWLVILPFIVCAVFVWPVFVDPLFNKFEPMEAKHPPLVAAIEKVTERGGLPIPPSRMYEMKASEKTTELNAYVTGFGASKRVVVWDTTIEKMTTAETLSVFGHEMGHYVLHHIVYGLIASCLGILALLYLIFHLYKWILPRFGPRWQISAVHDWAAMPLLLLLFGVLMFFSQPIGNGVSRYIEHQADVYGLEVIHGIVPDSQEVAAHAFQVLGEVGFDYPNPNRVAVFWFWTHPPIADRVRFAHDYDPWDKGEQPRYVK